MAAKVDELNAKMRTLCASKGIQVVEHANIDQECITKPPRKKNGKWTNKHGGVHPTKTGDTRLRDNFINFFGNL